MYELLESRDGQVVDQDGNIDGLAEHFNEDINNV